MSYTNAVYILGMQDANLRKINNFRIKKDGYEYRLTYKGGFSSYIAIDRREIGKRKFRFFGGVGAYHSATVADALDVVNKEIERETNKWKL